MHFILICIIILGFQWPTHCTEKNSTNKTINECDVCPEGNTSIKYRNKIDCNGDCFGSAMIDDCGICVGGNTREVPNAHKDCFGICFGQGVNDVCNVCGGDATTCKVCPKAAGYYKVFNCFAGPPIHRKPWPGKYVTCKQEICNKNWKDLLWIKGGMDAWFTLVRQYIGARLNLENTVHFSNKKAKTFVENTVQTAEEILERNCASIKMHNPDHTNALLTAYYLFNFNSRINSTLFSSECIRKNKPVTRQMKNETCFELNAMKKAIQPAYMIKYEMENSIDILAGDPLVQCVGGATLPVEYWAAHVSPYVVKRWANSSEQCGICGEFIDVLLADNPHITNDSFVFLAQEWIAAIHNIVYQPRACLTQWIADVLLDSYALLNNNCTPDKKSHIFVPVSSALGQQYMSNAAILHAYNVGEYGPFISAGDLIYQSRHIL